jgi:uncharacterized LabA/DUF88 family protein
MLNAEAVVKWAKSIGPRDSLLRIYWYDGEFNPRHAEYSDQRKYFDQLADVAGLQLRLGYVVERRPTWHLAIKHALKACGVSLNEFQKNFRFLPHREQKGVDALLTLDLVRLAQKGAFQWAVLVAGDRDFAEVVCTAQDEGRRIFVAVPTLKDLAPQLRQSADELLVIDPAVLTSFFDTGSGRSMPIAS